MDRSRAEGKGLGDRGRGPKDVDHDSRIDLKWVRQGFRGEEDAHQHAAALYHGGAGTSMVRQQAISSGPPKDGRGVTNPWPMCRDHMPARLIERALDRVSRSI